MGSVAATGVFVAGEKKNKTRRLVGWAMRFAVVSVSWDAACSLHSLPVLRLLANEVRGVQNWGFVDEVHFAQHLSIKYS